MQEVIWDEYPDVHQRSESLDFKWTGTTSFPRVPQGAGRSDPVPSPVGDGHSLRGKTIPASARSRNGETVVLFLVPWAKEPMVQKSMSQTHKILTELLGCRLRLIRCDGVYAEEDSADPCSYWFRTVGKTPQSSVESH